MIQQRKNRKRRNSSAPLIFAICVLSVILVLVVLIAMSLNPGGSGSTEPPVTTAPTSSGAQEGWVDQGGVLTYQKADGTLATGWLELDTGRYYLGMDGVMQTGWLTWEENRYYLAADGVMHTGWLEQEGKLYYLNDQGILQTGWLELKDTRYYLDETGAAVTGWQTLQDQEYYFRSSGAMARGIVEIDGERHFFTSAGIPIDLVNPWNPIPDDYEPDLVKLPDEIGNNRYVERICYEPLMQMINDCHAAMKEKYAGTGKSAPELFVRSSYRTNRDQEILFENKVQRVKAANPSLTQEEAEIEAAATVAIPGTSEHQLGIAVDIIDTQDWELSEKQETLEGQLWLMENCWRYGFILRYPKGTTPITGIIYEPWHYRYVGLEVAAEIRDLGVTLEEYLEGLS